MKTPAENISHELLSLTNDYVFRKIFGQKDVGALADFLSSVLDMPAEEFAELHVDDPHLYREHERGKGAELDVRAHTKSGEIINIEIQVNPEKAFRKRIVYYNSRIFSDQHKYGEPYHILNRTISVIITDFILFEENADCFNRFQWYNKANGTLLTSAQEINTFELPKLAQEDDGTKLWQWLMFLRLRRVEEMEAVARDNTAIKNVIGHIREMSADEAERRIAEAREKELLDRRAEVEYGVDKGIEMGKAEATLDTARRMKRNGFSDAEIMDITRLSKEAIAAL
jgi:predicted transposase/invertase (TIGR01784 family)